MSLTCEIRSKGFDKNTKSRSAPDSNVFRKPRARRQLSVAWTRVRKVSAVGSRLPGAPASLAPAETRARNSLGPNLPPAFRQPRVAHSLAAMSTSSDCGLWFLPLGASGSDCLGPEAIVECGDNCGNTAQISYPPGLRTAQSHTTSPDSAPTTPVIVAECGKRSRAGEGQL